MKTFSAWEYLLIDIANQSWNKDKLTFEQSINWTLSHLDQLEQLAEDRQWKHKPQYLKAVMALRQAQAGKPIGHMVGLDASCSGMQVASVLTGCPYGAEATGLIDPDQPKDAYGKCDELMSQVLGFQLNNQRELVKTALMTALYGSEAEPKKLFGDATPELSAFYKAMYQLAPGACTLLQVLKDSWNPMALYHAWKLPDGYDAKVKVTQMRESRVEVDELKSSFTYVYEVNEGELSGIKNPANVVHSVDAYVLRSLVRRCNYDPVLVKRCYNWLSDEQLKRRKENQKPQPNATDVGVQYYIDQYNRSTVPDIVILPYLTRYNVKALETSHIQGLLRILETMQEHKPFPVITVHDDFKCHPNYCNYLRNHYRQIMADIADSHLLDDLLSQLYHRPVTYHKADPKLGDKIRQSNYGLT